MASCELKKIDYVYERGCPIWHREFVPNIVAGPETAHLIGHQDCVIVTITVVYPSYAMLFL